MKKIIDDGKKVTIQGYDAFRILWTENVPLCILREFDLKGDTPGALDYGFDYTLEGEAAKWVIEQDWIQDIDKYLEMPDAEFQKTYFEFMTSDESQMMDQKILASPDCSCCAGNTPMGRYLQMLASLNYIQREKFKKKIPEV